MSGIDVAKLRGELDEVVVHISAEDAADRLAGASTTDDIEDVITLISSLSFSPGVNGRGSNGLLGEGVVNSGFLQIADIEFLQGGLLLLSREMNGIISCRINNYRLPGTRLNSTMPDGLLSPVTSDTVTAVVI